MAPLFPGLCCEWEGVWSEQSLPPPEYSQEQLLRGGNMGEGFPAWHQVMKAGKEFQVESSDNAK